MEDLEQYFTTGIIYLGTDDDEDGLSPQNLLVEPKKHTTKLNTFLKYYGLDTDGALKEKWARFTVIAVLPDRISFQEVESYLGEPVILHSDRMYVYETIKVDQLRQQCRGLNLCSAGNKSTLFKRLRQAMIPETRSEVSRRPRASLSPA